MQNFDVKKLGGYKLIFPVILLVGIFFRIYALDSKSIWVDEMYSIQMSKYSLTMIIDETSKDVHPPLYYILLHFFVSWCGDTEFAVRLLSVIFGSLSIFMAYKLGKILFEEETGFLFSLILAFSVYHIRYSQEARMYSLLILLTLTSFYFLIYIIKKRKLAYIVGYILSTGFLAYTHVFGLLIILVQNLYIITVCVFSNERSELTFKLWLMVQTVILILYAPWLKVLINQLLFVKGGAVNWIPIPTIDTVRISLWKFSGSELLFTIFLLLAFFSIFKLNFIKGRIKWINFFGSIQSYQWHVQLSNTREIYLLGIWLIVPVLFPFIISLVITPVYITRVTMTSSLALYLLAAKGIKNIGNKWITYATLAIVIGLSLTYIGRFYTDFKKEEWKEVAGFLDSNAKEGDLVLFYISWTQYPFDYYSKRKDLYKYGVHDLDWKDKAQIKKLKDDLNEFDRIWFIVSHSGEKEDDIKELIQQIHSLSDFKEYFGIKVYLFKSDNTK